MSDELLRAGTEHQEANDGTQSDRQGAGSTVSGAGAGAGDPWLGTAPRPSDNAIIGGLREKLRRTEDLSRGQDRALSNEIRAKTEARARADRLEKALRELDAWVSRMPDAGFSSDSPRWGWWHQRPRATVDEALAEPQL